MEVYYKDLISEEASLEKLVDDLVLAVQGANLAAQPRAEITTLLMRLKEGCRELGEHALTAGAATDKWVRKYPYSSLALAFALGVFSGLLLSRSSDKSE